MKKVLLLTGILLMLSCQSDRSDNVIVLVAYKTQPNKNLQAVAALKKLIDEVRKEPGFVGIKMHFDSVDNSNILLYEEWEDEAYHRNQHMKTEHLKAFIVESQSFLEAPPKISYWKESASFE